MWIAEPRTASPTDVMQPVPEVLPSKRDEAIAVMPFRNMSAEPQSDYFSEGISEEILNRLGTFDNLRVIARASSFSYKDKDIDPLTIAHQLEVDY